MMNKIEHEGLIGIGLYRSGEAARLVGLAPQRLRRWIKGEKRSDRGAESVHPALGFRVADEGFLDFRDLMELRVIAALVNEGMSPGYVRAIYASIAALMEDERPFSTERFSQSFKTDGHAIYHRMVDRAGKVRLEEMLTGQGQFERMIAPSLRNVEFDQGLARRWRPKEGRNDVVIDPDRSFGQPVSDRSGVPTVTLFEAYRRTASLKRTAAEFEIDEREVRSAILFEERLAA